MALRAGRMQSAFVRRAILASICCVALSLGMAPRGRADDLPGYRPQAQVSGTIRLWGSPDDGRLIAQLAAGFRKYQPGVRLQPTLHGPESTFAAVYMDVADIGLMAREIR